MQVCEHTFQTHDSLFWFQNDSNAIGVSEIYLKKKQQAEQQHIHCNSTLYEAFTQ